MDRHHTMQIEFHDLKHCNPGCSVRVRSGGVSQVAFILAAIAVVSLVSPSSVQHTMSAQLHAVGSFVMSKKALFVLSNAIFLFLAADYYRCFFSLSSPSTAEFTAREQTGVLDKQDHLNNVRAPDDEMLPGEQMAREAMAMPSQPEVFMLDGGEVNSVIQEKVVIEEPTCGAAAQELEKLGIDELNKKFDEFIKSRRNKWEEEAGLQ
uniref:DUF4408 domain-containing protein n=1 Tax=Oryza brachyantha TaxID=4533 RepID=J3LQL4_ORYBR